MVTRWSERDTLKLIHLYKSYEFLWDKDTELYKNIYARKQAYDAIVNEMQIPDLTAQDVRSKIKNLRTSYYQELRKIASCKANNKPPKQVKWFLAFKSVMGNVSHDPGVPKVSSKYVTVNELRIGLSSAIQNCPVLFSTLLQRQKKPKLSSTLSTYSN